MSEEIFIKLKRYIAQNQQTFSDKSEPHKEIDKIVGIFRDWVLAVQSFLTEKEVEDNKKDII